MGQAACVLRTRGARSWPAHLTSHEASARRLVAHYGENEGHDDRKYPAADPKHRAYQSQAGGQHHSH